MCHTDTSVLWLNKYKQRDCKKEKRHVQRYIIYRYISIYLTRLSSRFLEIWFSRNMVIKRRGFPSQTNEKFAWEGNATVHPIVMGSERRHSARVSVFGRYIAHLKIFTNIYRGPCTGGWLHDDETTSEVATSVDTLCSRANICPVSKSFRDTGWHRRTERIWPVNPVGLENANRMNLLFHTRSPCCGGETSPDVGPDKNVANHGLPVRGAASFIALPLERLRRNARAGLFFVSSMLSA